MRDDLPNDDAQSTERSHQDSRSKGVRGEVGDCEIGLISLKYQC